MKKLLLTSFIAFAVSFTVNAQSAKIKKHAAAQAEKKAKEDAVQERKKQLDIEAQKQRNAPQSDKIEKATSGK
jgi:hypothetical protein